MIQFLVGHCYGVLWGHHARNSAVDFSISYIYYKYKCRGLHSFTPDPDQLKDWMPNLDISRVDQQGCLIALKRYRNSILTAIVLMGFLSSVFTIVNLGVLIKKRFNRTESITDELLITPEEITADIHTSQLA
ncbi:hypothetical protein HZS_6439 [Henneguya salminicola]|nr:hypothetical protein HZS_6439 [Henneguya salminicola]